MELNIFSPFKVNELSETFNKMPTVYGQFNRSNLFKPVYIWDNSVFIEEVNGALRILESRPMGSLGQGLPSEGRALRGFKVPHFPVDTHIGPADVRHIRMEGVNRPKAAAELVASRLERHKQAHDITKESLLVSALQGKAIDGAGRVLLDSFAEYGVTQEVVELDAASDVIKLKKLFRDIGRIQSDALIGDTMTTTELPVSRALFDAIVDHPVVQKHYLGTQFAPSWLSDDTRSKGFVIEGVRIYEYSDKAPDFNGQMRNFIKDGEGIAYPLGTMNTFRLYCAPADFNETLGQRGKELYAKVREGDFERGWQFHSQSNLLPICLNPKVLVKVKIK